MVLKGVYHVRSAKVSPVTSNRVSPIFLGAAVYSVVSIIVWMLFYMFVIDIFVTLPVSVWHAHEMIFGYTMAVVAGFLLTAVMNWTNEVTLHGNGLLSLFGWWTAGRVLAFFPGTKAVQLLALCDTVFLIIALMRPIIKTKKWKQMAVLSKVFMMLLINVCFYAAFFNNNDIHTEKRILLFGVYIIVSLILTITRRIMPFFISRGVWTMTLSYVIQYFLISRVFSY
ncbi:MAG: hypothetical protein ACI8Q2_000476 [Candidatus Omnitrophota bacterium]